MTACAERQFALGRAQKIVGVLGGVGDDERLRIGETDILDRHADEAAGEEQRSSPPSSMRAS